MKLGIAGIVVAALVGCSSTHPARSVASARGGIALVARGVLAADAECASVARAIVYAGATASDVHVARSMIEGGKRLAAECSLEARTARATLELAEATLDVADATIGRSVGCAAVAGLHAISRIRELLAIAGRPLPVLAAQALDEADALAGLVAGVCVYPVAPAASAIATSSPATSSSGSSSAVEDPYAPPPAAAYPAASSSVIPR